MDEPISWRRHQLPRIFTADPAVVDVTSKVLSVMAFYIAADGLQGVLGGVLRGSGRQGRTVPVMFISYYVVALPAAYLLGFTFNMGVRGLLLLRCLFDMALVMLCDA